MRHVQDKPYRVQEYPDTYYLYKGIVFEKAADCWKVGDEMRSILHFLGYAQTPVVQSGSFALTIFRITPYRIPLETLDAALTTALTVLDARPVTP